MRHEKSLFHGLTKHIPWAVFERLVAEHKADHGVRRLDSRSQLVALLFGQFSGASSLREIEAGLTSHQARRRIADATRIIDATKVRLSDLSADWARFSDDHCAAKLHIVYDPHGAMPLKAYITPDTVNAIPAKALKIEPGATYVFDLAYYDFGWWAELNVQD